MPDPSNAICLTIGDPTGISSEIAAKFLHSGQYHHAERLYVIGDMVSLQNTAYNLGIGLPVETNALRYIDMQTDARDKLPGQLCYDALEEAVRLIHAGSARTLVTGPISKENLQAAGLPYSGHTEILQQLARRFYQQPCQSDMLFLYKNFRMLLLTRHVALRKVSESLSIKGVSKSLDNLAVFLKDHCGIAQPRLCLLGVNPHAGELEQGGGEEERILKPACRMVSQKHCFEIDPPVAADAAFRQFDLNNLQYDAFVAAYHDQGLIPFKIIAGYSAVNITIGLPFLRTSVSHGTAPDIVGQGIADPSSLIEAFNCALQLAPQQSQALISG